MERTVESLTALLIRAGIDPNGYGERIGETREEHVARILREAEENTKGEGNGQSV